MKTSSLIINPYFLSYEEVYYETFISFRPDSL